jgi:acetyltransferase-like isoleucine patch superfamily enzyme
MENELLKQLKKLYNNLSEHMLKKFHRHVSFGDLVTDRWETAKNYGFGEGTSCYDNVLIIGEVKVGNNTWIGPNCILDGSGGLEIGDYCSISAGVQIYSHHTVNWATSFGCDPTETASVKIGSGVYIGPQTVIQMGVTIGDKAAIGACSFVNSDVPSETKVWGCPAKIQKRKKTAKELKAKQK